MKKKLLLSVAVIGLSCLSVSASAADLIEVFQQASRCDPLYKQAYAKMLSIQEGLPQAVSTLLPNISGNGNTSGNYINIFSISGLPPNLTPEQAAAAGLGVNKFNSQQYGVNLSQTIINFTNWMQVVQQKNIYKQAAATFAAALQDLIIRVATAYFNVLEAQDKLTYTLAQKAANWRELDQTKQRYKVGLDSITSVYNAQAAYDAIVADVVAAQNTLQNNQEALRQLTGVYYCRVEGLKIELPLLPPIPMDVCQWTAAAERYNQPLVAAEYGARAGLALIKANFGGHLPNLSAVGSYTRYKGTSFGTTDLDQGIIGLQVNVPIYQGGFVNSQVRQAEADYANASAEVQNTYLKAIVTTRQNFNNVLSGICQVKADRAAIISAKSSVDSTEESFKVGIRTIVDVLLAQKQLYESRTNYAIDEYAYLLSTLQLKQSAGVLCPRDLCLINLWLHGPDQIEHDPYQPRQHPDEPLPPITDQKKTLPGITEKTHPHLASKEKHEHLTEPKKSTHLAQEKKIPSLSEQTKHPHLTKHPSETVKEKPHFAKQEAGHSIQEKLTSTAEKKQPLHLAKQ